MLLDVDEKYYLKRLEKDLTAVRVFCLEGLIFPQIVANQWVSIQGQHFYGARLTFPIKHQLVITGALLKGTCELYQAAFQNGSIKLANDDFGKSKIAIKACVYDELDTEWPV